MRIISNTAVRGEAVRNWMTIAALAWACGCLHTEASEPLAAPKAVADPQILQFRILAGTETDELVCERAKALEEKETKWDPLESTCRHASLSIL